MQMKWKTLRIYTGQTTVWSWSALLDNYVFQGVPQSQTASLPRHQEEEETDKTEEAQIEQT